MNKTKEKKQFFSATESKVRLVMFFKQGYYNLQGKESELQYSLLNMNKKTHEKIIEAMSKSFIYGKYRNKIKTALFYDNITGKELKKLKF